MRRKSAAPGVTREPEGSSLAPGEGEGLRAGHSSEKRWQSAERMHRSANGVETVGKEGVCFF